MAYTYGILTNRQMGRPGSLSDLPTKYYGKEKLRMENRCFGTMNIAGKIDSDGLSLNAIHLPQATTGGALLTFLF
jgi:hypothetical protein